MVALDELEISVETYNALKSMVIDTEKLITMTSADLLQIRRIGPRRVAEIKNALSLEGLWLRNG